MIRTMSSWATGVRSRLRRMALGLPDFALGDSIGGYRLEERLGEGGMGLVFRARREGDGQPVALKVMKAEFASDETHRRRFLHEARAAAGVRHPNLVPILEAGEAG